MQNCDSDTGREVLSQQNRRKADSFATSLTAIIEEIKTAGYRTVRAIAAELNCRDVPTWRGAHWYVTNTHALLKRIERIKSAS